MSPSPANGSVPSAGPVKGTTRVGTRGGGASARAGAGARSRERRTAPARKRPMLTSTSSP